MAEFLQTIYCFELRELYFLYAKSSKVPSIRYAESLESVGLSRSIIQWRVTKPTLRPQQQQHSPIILLYDVC